MRRHVLIPRRPLNKRTQAESTLHEFKFALCFTQTKTLSNFTSSLSSIYNSMDYLHEQQIPTKKVHGLIKEPGKLPGREPVRHTPKQILAHVRQIPLKGLTCVCIFDINKTKPFQMFRLRDMHRVRNIQVFGVDSTNSCSF